MGMMTDGMGRSPQNMALNIWYSNVQYLHVLDPEDLPLKNGWM